MPQMSPLPWLNLFALSTSVFLCITAITYFNPITSTNSKLPLKSPQKTITWKW